MRKDGYLQVTITRNSGKRGMGHSRAKLEGELKAITGTSDFRDPSGLLAQSRHKGLYAAGA